MNTKPILVLGIGNILLKDEGVGVHVVQAMEAKAAVGEIHVPDDVEFFDGGTFGIDLVDTLVNRRKVIVVDAAQANAPPATVLRVRREDLAARSSADLSLHQVGLLETLTMARHLGGEPAEVVVIGIVPKDMSPGLELSPEVSLVVPHVIEMVLREIPGAGART